MARRGDEKEVRGVVADWVILAREREGWYTGGRITGVEEMFNDPEKLRLAAIMYFDWAETNRILVGEMIKGGTMAGEIYTVPYYRVFSISGLAVYLGMGVQRFNRLCKRPELVDVRDWIDTVIRAQKFELAAVGAINASLIIKDLGLDGLNVEGVPQGNALKIEVRNGEAATSLALLKENLEGNVSE